MTVYEFIRNFNNQDLFDADKRRMLEQSVTLLARFIFDDLFHYGSCHPEIVNHYDLAREKLKTPTDMVNA